MDICYTLHTFTYMYVTMYEIFYIFANIGVNLINKTFTVQLVSSPISWESSASPLPTDVLPSYKEEQVEIVWYIFKVQTFWISFTFLHNLIWLWASYTCTCLKRLVCILFIRTGLLTSQTHLNCKYMHAHCISLEISDSFFKLIKINYHSQFLYTIIIK